MSTARAVTVIPPTTGGFAPIVVGITEKKRVDLETLSKSFC
jgi:hypothetical protein